MIKSIGTWFCICLFIALAYNDNLQDPVAVPVQEAGSRLVQAGGILFAGGCTHVFRCEKVIKETEQVVENVTQ